MDKKMVWYCSRLMKGRDVKENAQAFIAREDERKQKETASVRLTVSESIAI